MIIPDLTPSPTSIPLHAGINEALAHARTLAPTVDQAYRAAQQKLSLIELERLYRDHSSAFAFHHSRLKSIVIDGLSEHWSKPIETFQRANFNAPTPPRLSSNVSGVIDLLKTLAHYSTWRKRYNHGLELQRHDQKAALLFEHIGDFDRAFAMRMAIAKTGYSQENTFAVARLLERSLPKPVFKTFLTNQFKTGSPDFLLALARYYAFSADTTDADEIVAFRESIRISADRAPENIKLQLALGFAELSSGNHRAARRQFTMAWILSEQQRRAAIDVGQGSPEHEIDPWSLGYAFAYISEEPQSRGYGFFRMIDATGLNIAGAKLLRAEGKGLWALSFYGSLINSNFASRAHPKHIAYQNYWITYHEDRWVAVPRSLALSWMLPASLGSSMPAAERRLPKWSLVGKIKITIGNILASLIRFGLRLPGSGAVLDFLVRIRQVVFRRFAVYFGVVFASELSTLKQKIDVLSRREP